MSGAGGGDGGRLAAAARPRLAARARLQRDPVAAQDLLLFPEGAMQLGGTGGAVLRCCDGRRPVAAVVAALAAQFAVPAASIEAEVHAFLAGLRDRRLLDV